SFVTTARASSSSPPTATAAATCSWGTRPLPRHGTRRSTPAPASRGSCRSVWPSRRNPSRRARGARSDSRLSRSTRALSTSWEGKRAGWRGPRGGPSSTSALAAAACLCLCWGDQHLHHARAGRFGEGGDGLVQRETPVNQRAHVHAAFGEQGERGG